MLPYVVLLDCDGCMVGDVSSHINEWIIHKNTAKDKTMHNFNKTMRWSMRNGLLRPYFTEFINDLFGQHGNEVFVYTASTSDWAPVVISNIEHVTGKKFARPIFSREFCHSQNGTLKKSIGAVKPVVFQRLRRKYPDLKNADQLNGRILMVDNSDVLIDQWAWVACPTYDYTPTWDVLKHVDWDVLKDNYTTVYRELMKQDMLPRAHVADFDAFLSLYYTKLAKYIGSNGEKNVRERKDDFWKRCKNVMVPALSRLNTKNGVINAGFVRMLNKALQQRAVPEVNSKLPVQLLAVQASPTISQYGLYPHQKSSRNA